MATYYWVGGTGTWDATTTTNWATSSGGTGGAGVPTSADNVIIDTNSGTGTITCTAGVCNDITVTATQAITLGNTNSTLSIYGNMVLPSGGSFSAGANYWTITFCATTTGKTITTNGKSLVFLIFNGVGGGWSLGSALTIGSAYSLTLTNGALDTAGYSVSGGGLALGAGTKTLNLNGSTLTLSGTAPINFATNSAGFTFNAGTSTISCSSSVPTFAGGGFTFYNVSFTSTVFTTPSITGANTFNNLTFASRVSSGIGTVSIGANQTVNGTLTAQSGNTNPPLRIFFYSDVLGTQRTITAAAIDIQCADFRDIVGAGAATWSDSTRAKYWGDCQGNSGITFNAGRSVYWNLSGANNWSSIVWAATNNGTPNAQYFPLAQDTATFTEAGTVGTVVVNTNWQIGSIQMADGISNRTTAFTFAVSTNIPTIYGNVTLFSALTFTGGGPIFFAGKGTQNITSAGVNWTQSLTVNNATGTVRLLDALTIASTATFTLTSGTLDLNNNSLTCGIFSSSNTNTRSIAFGTGNITLTGSGNFFNMDNALNFTYSGTSRIEVAASFGGGYIRFGSVDAASASESNALNFRILGGSNSIVFYAGSTQTKVNNVIFENAYSGQFGDATNANLAYPPYAYGDVVLSPNSTFSFNTSGAIRFLSASKTQLFTTNGKTWPISIVKEGTGTLQLQDALTMLSTQTITLTAGTLDLNGKTLTTGTFSSSNSNVRTLAFGSNATLNCQTAYTATTSTNMTVTGTGTINMTNSSAKTFAGGGLDYSGITLNQGGAGALTITGANSFYDISNTVTPATVIFPAGVTTTVTNLSLAGTGNTDTTSTLPTNMSRLTIGGSALNSGREFNGTIKSVKYYPKRLSSTVLSGLTLQ